MMFRMERAGAGNFDHIAAPQTFRSIQLNKGSAAAVSFPRFERQILDAMHADAAMNRYTFALYEIVVGRVRSIPSSDPGVFAPLWLAPLKRVNGWGRHLILLCFDPSPFASVASWAI